MEPTKITMDPLNKFPGAEHNWLLKACGFLPQWIMEAEGMSYEEEYVTMKDRLLANYVYFMGELTGGELHSDGSYSYPEDPTLFALVKFEFNGEKCFIFEHAIVGIINQDGSTWVTRMD